MMSSPGQASGRVGSRQSAIVGALVILLGGLALASITAVNAGAADTKVEGLTAAQIAEKFELKPIYPPIVVTDCDRLVGTEEVGYCLDDLQVDDWTREHIAAQLRGYEDNEAMHAYVDATVERNRLKAESTDDPEISSELVAAGNEVLALQSKMTKVSDGE